MPQFASTIKHIKDGVKSFTVAAAVKNIEGWEATLEKVEVAGTKTIIKDLESAEEASACRADRWRGGEEADRQVGQGDGDDRGEGGFEERREDQGIGRGAEPRREPEAPAA